MISVDQTILHGEDQVGNCFQACVASIMELSIDEVPHFCDHPNWPSNFDYWLDAYNLYWVEFMCPNGGPDGRSEYWGHHIISGPSPRGDFLHAVVGVGDTIIHDPHPSRDGVLGLPSEWKYGFFVPKNIAKIFKI
jgi:hypothetical protein